MFCLKNKHKTLFYFYTKKPKKPQKTKLGQMKSGHSGYDKHT